MTWRGQIIRRPVTSDTRRNTEVRRELTYASALRGNLVDEEEVSSGIEAKLHDEGCGTETPQETKKMVSDHHDQALAKTTT